MPSCKMVLRWQYRCWTQLLVCAVGLLLEYTCQGATTIKGPSLRESVVILHSHTQRSYNLYTVMVWTEAAAISTCTYENAAVTSYRA